jgi:hypothetical protein
MNIFFLGNLPAPVCPVWSIAVLFPWLHTAYLHASLDDLGVSCASYRRSYVYLNLLFLPIRTVSVQRSSIGSLRHSR